MYTLKAENEYNNIITLTSNKNYVIISVEGLNPPPAIINKVKNASEDGSTLNSTSLDDRQIIITLNINAPVEKNRIELFKYFKTGKNVKLYYSNDTRNVNIEGIVQNFTVDYFAKKQVGQITIDCTKPFFKDVDQETKVLSNVENLLEFPLSIEEPIAFSEISENNIHLINAGDVETGFIATVHATGGCSNPVIYNLDTNKYFGVNIELNPGDDLIISTVPKEKAAILNSNGVEVSVVGKIINGSDWLTLIPGSNELHVSFTGQPEDVETTFNVKQLYLGV